MYSFSTTILLLLVVIIGCHSFVIRPNNPSNVNNIISSSQQQQKQKQHHLLTSRTPRTTKHHHHQQQHQQQRTQTAPLFSSSNNNNDDDSNNNDSIIHCDVLVLGAGPTGRAMTKLLANADLKVVLADAKYDSPLVPNYGVWLDEWQSIVDRYSQKHNIELKGGKCGKALNQIWQKTDCFFGGSFDTPMTERTRLDRPYGQVDKYGLVDSFQLDESTGNNIQIIRANHKVQQTFSLNLHGDTMVHSEQGTTTQLSNGQTVFSTLVVDATGHESKLVLRQVRDAGEAPPGFQIAYGVAIETDAPTVDDPFFGPYDKDCMTLFDYRTDHLTTDRDSLKHAEKEPTFMYVMPLSDTKVFFEETSLVARDPAMSFQEAKDRCMKRLEYLGIPVRNVLEEE